MWFHSLLSRSTERKDEVEWNGVEWNGMEWFHSIPLHPKTEHTLNFSPVPIWLAAASGQEQRLPALAGGERAAAPGQRDQETQRTPPHRREKEKDDLHLQMCRRRDMGADLADAALLPCLFLSC
jgi:hypothetical protein